MKYPIGEKIRVVRKRKGLTLKEVARVAQVSDSLISQIERDRISPAIETLLKIVEVLDIDMEYLFGDFRKTRSLHVVRKQERRLIRQDGVTYEGLSRIESRKDEHGIEAYYMEIKPGCQSGSSDYGHPGKELGTIISGQGLFSIGDQSVKLYPGDSISFASDSPHRLENTGTNLLKAFWTITPPKETLGQT